MEIAQVDLANAKEVRKFIDLPFRLYANTPQWVPPIKSDMELILNPRRHPFYRHSQAGFFICLRSDHPVGRLAVLDNARYNRYNNSRAAFFYFFEAENEPEIAALLFDAGIRWAKSRGLSEMIGPKGFTPFDGLGLLVKGFEHRPAFGLPYNPQYYAGLLEGLGFETCEENVSGYMDPAGDFPARIDLISKKIQSRRGLQIQSYSTRRELRALIPDIKELYNGALEGTTGTYPLDDSDVKSMADQLLWFADPKMIKVVMKTASRTGEKLRPVGFILAYPDVSSALQKTGGRLFPFGWLTLLRERRRTDWVNINGAGMINEYRGLGGTAILFSEMYKTIHSSAQFKHAEIVQIGIENDRMQRELRDLGVDFYKMHRVYRKEIVQHV